MNTIDPRPLTRRTFGRLAASLTGAAVLLPLNAMAQATPQPDLVRILTGFSAGGTADLAARKVAERLGNGAYARTACVVENRTGAGGRIAVEATKFAPADGATLMLTAHSVLSVYPGIYTKLSYNAFEDLAPVSTVASFSHALAVGPMVPSSVRSLKDFLAWAMANPKDANYASPAAGSIPHFIGALLAKNSGVPMQHVPYRGGVPGVADVIGGQIACMVTPVGDFLANYKAGRLRILATSAAARTPFTPEVPTFVEQGIDYINFDEWFAIFAPARTPPTMIERASAAINKSLADPDVVSSLAIFGLAAGGSTPQQLKTMLHDEYERWKPITKEIGFTADS